MNMVDKVWKMVGGRKFLAWLGTSGLLIGAQISAENWLVVTLCYIGGQSAVDALASLRGNKKPSTSVAKAMGEDELEA